MTTAVQLSLIAPLVEPDYEREATLPERFAAFHALNPHVADALERLARQWLTDHDHVGVKALVERLRWDYGIQTKGDAFRLNNSFTAFYADLLIERNPHWVNAIQRRARKAKS